MVEKLIIVGSGPAAYTAAIYGARAGLSPLLIQGAQPGGQLMITTDVENFPGFASIQGPDLMEKMADHAKKMGTRLQSDTIQRVVFAQDKHSPHKLFGLSGSYEAHAVIVATGASARWLGLESEKKYQGFGVSACATCDGPFFKNKRVAVVGGGNTAAEESLFLTNHATEVFLIHRRDQLRAEHVLQQQVLKHPKIKILWNQRVTMCHGNEKPFKHLTGLTLENTQDHSTQQLDVDGLFIAIGHTPNTSFLNGTLQLDAEGYIVGQRESMRTEIPGIFVAGDVKDKVYRQAITAAGQGCMAALDATHYVNALT